MAYAAPYDVALSRVATYMVGHPVSVACEPDTSDLGGWVWIVNGQAENVIHLTWCRELRKLIRTPGAYLGQDQESREQAALAFTTLGHEAEHIRLNSDDEGRVDCEMYHRLRTTVQYMPIKQRYREILLRYSRSVYRAQPLDTEYRTEC